MGVKAAVCGLIVVTTVRLIKQMCQSAAKASSNDDIRVQANDETMCAHRMARIRVAFVIVMSALSFISVGFLGITAIAVILIAIAVGIIFHCLTIKWEVKR